MISLCARPRRATTPRPICLHRALRNQLGESAQQAGSLVSPEGLRFDFNHYEKLPAELLKQIELEVNTQVMADRSVLTSIKDLDTAKQEGATALFGEKYEDSVRVVEVEGFSKELCGGTHVSATGEIGPFVITAESSVAAGVRRIEALSGSKAVEYLLEGRDLLAQQEQTLAAGRTELLARVTGLIQKSKQMEKELAELTAQAQQADMDTFLAEAG